MPVLVDFVIDATVLFEFRRFVSAEQGWPCEIRRHTRNYHTQGISKNNHYTLDLQQSILTVMFSLPAQSTVYISVVEPKLFPK